MCLLALIVAFSVFQLSTAGAPRLLPFVYEPYHKKHEPELGAVSSLSAVCSNVGTEILEVGGNAADAMVATEFCLGVIGMHSSGLGGGGFMLIRASNGSYECVDFRETAPSAAFQDMYKDDGAASLWGGLASGVPGELRGLEYLYNSYCSLSWSRLIEPSIYLARNGFVVNQDLVDIFHGENDPRFLTEDPSWATDFAPGGTLVKVGDTITRKRYGNLLENIAKDGPEVFYTGTIANATVNALQAKNGSMTLADLRDYKVALRAPMEITYRDYKIRSCGAPSSGVVVLSVMKTIEGYPEIGRPQSLNLSTHHLNEAIRFGYGARTELGDPSFIRNTSTFQLEMLKPSTASKIRSLISDSKTLPVSSYDPNGIESLETPGTSHVSTADASGLAIALTSTINLWFGSKVMVPETGLIMNDIMNDFSTPGQSDNFGYIASPANYIAPGKRPLSSMSPVIVEFVSNNSLYYVLGGAGGSHIITSVIQCLWNVLDRNMPLLAALQTPRFHDQLVPDETEFEPTYDNSTVAFLAQLGHNVTWLERQSDIEALRRLPNGTFEAAGEPILHNSGGFAV